jgi:hypothetical protein
VFVGQGRAEDIPEAGINWLNMTPEKHSTKIDTDKEKLDGKIPDLFHVEDCLVRRLFIPLKYTCNRNR